MIISLILWALSSFGPGDKMHEAGIKYQQQLAAHAADTLQLKKDYANTKLENSYVGIIGKSLEPVIKPLGYDWKIGIAIVTSFAAREVFVGTMATLYSVGNEKNKSPLKEKMKAAVYPDGRAVYSLATGVSLMLFYAFAMQCMSTLAVVRRETRSWKWPLIQLVYMTGMAYVISLLAYQLLKN
jgi:ferrous iron transport protein B